MRTARPGRPGVPPARGAALLSCLLLCANASALENPGVSAAPILQIPTSARSAGMGFAFAGAADDLGALQSNPAGLAAMNSRAVGFDYVKGFTDQTIEQIGAVSPLPFSGFFGGGYTSLGASGLFAQNGTIEVNRTNLDGSFRDSRTIDAGHDLVASLAYSERVAQTSIDDPRGSIAVRHFLGLSAKFIRSTLAQEYSAQACAADAGYFVQAPELGLQAGAAAQNMGTKLRFIDEGDPLPMTFRGGISYLLPLNHHGDELQHTLRLAADGDYLYYDRLWHAGVGLEYSFLRSCSLRVGYQLNREAAGLAFGFGVLWQGISFDYAWGMSEDLGDVHRFSMAWRFGKVSQRRRELPPRPFIESMPEREGLSELEKKTPRPLEDRPLRPRRSIRDDDTLPNWIY